MKIKCSNIFLLSGILPLIWLSNGCTEKKYSFEIQEMQTPGKSSLRAIHALDENTIWTAGSQGQVLLTLDGGEHWKQMTIPGCEDTEFRSLHAWDALRALVFDISPEGRACMTTDGGESWKQVYSSPEEGAFFNSLKFADEKRGIAISDPVDDQVFILRTTDGGLSWQRLENTPPAEEGEINFAASNTCIEYLPSGEIFIVTGGSKSRILSSWDHGEHWEYVETPAMTGESAGLFSVGFHDSKTGVAVGGDYSDPEREGIRAIYTRDGGLHWQEAKHMPAEYRSCVISLKKRLVFAIGKTGCDYSTDGGRNWAFIDSVSYYAASSVPDKDMLYLSGANGRVARVIVYSDKE
jgi:photosystem II stability/assembly factor-like uncharacterized protein